MFSTEQRRIAIETFIRFGHSYGWAGVTIEEFMGMLDAYLRRYRDIRIKSDLDCRSPMQYRRDLGLAAKDGFGPGYPPQSRGMLHYPAKIGN